jgi:hypothetical protein
MDEILAQLFPQAPSYFPGLLGQEQANLLQQQAQRQGLLGIGMGLLQAAAPSTTRPSLGAGIAQGLATGQQMAQNVYMQRLQEQQIAQKLAEQQRLLQQQETMRKLFPQVFQQTVERGAVAGEEGPIPTAQQRISIDPQKLSMLAMASGDPLAALANIAKTVPELRKSGLIAGAETSIDPFAPFLTIDNPNLQAIAAQYSRAFKTGALDETQIGRALESLGKMAESAGATTADIKGYNLAVTQAQQAGQPVPSYLDYKRSLAEAGRTVIDMTGGQKGFENERSLRTEFQGSPEYKAFGEMKAAYGQVLEGLNKKNAIGDVAAATKIMKLLDPGSVVRESELAIAMNSSGLLDRVSNYATNIINGTKLSPEQRREFSSLANSLFSVSLDAFNEKRNQYSGLAKDYGFDINRIIGAEPSIPGLQKQQETPTLSLQQQAAQLLEQRRKQRGQ